VRLRGEAQQRLCHGQAYQFAVGQPRWSPDPPDSGEIVVDFHVECGDEGVQVCRHKQSLDILTTFPQAIGILV